MSTLPQVAFSYGALAADVATQAREAAERIRGRHQKQIASILETGRDLLAIKDKLEHGQFGGWLEAEFGWAERTARNYMSAAEEFGLKSATVADLPPSTIYALAAKSTPAPVREAIVSRLEAGEKITPAQIVEEVKEAKEAAREERQEAKRTPSQRRYQKQTETARRQEAEEAAERNRKKVAALVRAEAFLRSHLGDDLAEFLAILEEVDIYSLGRSLKEKLAEAA